MALGYDLRDELAFYRKYHSDSTNVLIHVIFVPTILFSTLVQLCNLVLPVSVVSKFDFIPPSYYQYVNLGVITAIGYSLFYTLLDLPFGIPSVAVLVTSAIKLSDLVSSPDGWTYTKWSFWICGMAWIFQFAGHALYENRSPALLNNLAQALVMAPLFVVFEVAYWLGFRRDIIDEVDAKIKPELEAFRAAKEAKKSKKSK